MWRTEKEDPDYDPSKPITRALFPDHADVVCGIIKYRCPAAAFGFDCAGSEPCHRAGGVEPGEYGRIVRIDLDKHYPRISTPTPWGSPS